jgi:hypothetical protein
MAKPNSKRLKAKFIKTSFKDLTAEDLRLITDDTPRGLIAALSNLTAEEVANLTATEVLALYELVSFVEDLSEAGAALPPGADLPDVDVASDTFEKAELAKLKIGTLKKPYRLFPELVRIYYGEELLTGPASTCLALGALIYQDLAALVERFKDLAGEPPTDEEEEAGVAALHTFGPYGLAESIAAKYHLRPYDVFKWSAEEVYLELTYQLAKSRYQDNLREIERRKTPK